MHYVVNCLWFRKRSQKALSQNKTSLTSLEPFAFCCCQSTTTRICRLTLYRLLFRVCSFSGPFWAPLSTLSHLKLPCRGWSGPSWDDIAPPHVMNAPGRSLCSGAFFGCIPPLLTPIEPRPLSGEEHRRRTLGTDAMMVTCGPTRVVLSLAPPGPPRNNSSHVSSMVGEKRWEESGWKRWVLWQALRFPADQRRVQEISNGGVSMKGPSNPNPTYILFQKHPWFGLLYFLFERTLYIL